MTKQLFAYNISGTSVNNLNYYNINDLDGVVDWSKFKFMNYQMLIKIFLDIAYCLYILYISLLITWELDFLANPPYPPNLNFLESRGESGSIPILLGVLSSLV
mgnify:CR=1 FL=1